MRHAEPEPEPPSPLVAAIEAHRVKQEARARAIDIEAGALEVEDLRERRLREKAEEARAAE